MVFEEKTIKIEELPMEEHISADLLSCYDQFSASLPPASRIAFEQFADVVCWDYRDTPQPLDSTFQPEGIHFSCSPATCARLASTLASMDEASVRQSFVKDSAIQTADFFLGYLAAWRDIFKRAADSKQFVFAFIP
ncbi:MAG: hypothetical protein ABIZ56_04825 [Chthoniobacteraceae bacterium]